MTLTHAGSDSEPCTGRMTLWLIRATVIFSLRKVIAVAVTTGLYISTVRGALSKPSAQPARLPGNSVSLIRWRLIRGVDCLWATVKITEFRSFPRAGSYLMSGPNSVVPAACSSLRTTGFMWQIPNRPGHRRRRADRHHERDSNRFCH